MNIKLKVYTVTGTISKKLGTNLAQVGPSQIEACHFNNFIATAKTRAYLGSWNIQLSEYDVDFGPDFIENNTENPKACSWEKRGDTHG